MLALGDDPLGAVAKEREARGGALAPCRGGSRDRIEGVRAGSDAAEEVREWPLHVDAWLLVDDHVRFDTLGLACAGEMARAECDELRGGTPEDAVGGGGGRATRGSAKEAAAARHA